MSSPPSPRSLDGLVEEWHPGATRRSDVMAALEPYREHVDELMAGFDDETQSWRDYCSCIWGGYGYDGAIPKSVQTSVSAMMREPAPAEKPAPATPHAPAVRLPAELPDAEAFARSRHPNVLEWRNVARLDAEERDAQWQPHLAAERAVTGVWRRLAEAYQQALAEKDATIAAERAARERAERAAEEAQRKLGWLAEEHKAALATIAEQRAQLALVTTGTDDVWHWMGDGSDHPESLVDSCPVVMRADTLRDLLQRIRPAPDGIPGEIEVWTGDSPHAHRYVPTSLYKGEQAARDKAEHELAEARAALSECGATAGHNKPCYYCGEMCNALVGDPGRWPVPLCHAEDPGKVKWHHIGCVSKRIQERDDALTSAERAQAAWAEQHEQRQIAERDLAEARAEASRLQGISDKARIYADAWRAHDDAVEEAEAQDGSARAAWDETTKARISALALARRAVHDALVAEIVSPPSLRKGAQPAAEKRHGAKRVLGSLSGKLVIPDLPEVDDGEAEGGYLALGDRLDGELPKPHQLALRSAVIHFGLVAIRAAEIGARAAYTAAARQCELEAGEEGSEAWREQAGPVLLRLRDLFAKHGSRS